MPPKGYRKSDSRVGTATLEPPTLGKPTDGSMDDATLAQIQEDETKAALAQANRSRRIKVATKRRRTMPVGPLEIGQAIVTDPAGANPRLIPALDLLFPAGEGMPLDDEFHSDPRPVGNHYYKIAQGHLRVVRFNPHPIEMLTETAQGQPLFPGCQMFKTENGEPYFRGRLGEFWNPMYNPNPKFRAQGME